MRGARAFGVIAAAVLLAVTSCTVGRTTATSDEIVVLSGRDDSEGHRRLQLVEEWGAEHGAKVRLVELTGSADQQHNEMLKEAQAPDSVVDVFTLDVTWTAEFADAGYVRRLPEPPEDADFLPGPLEAGRYRGSLYALPFNTDAGLMYHDSALVDCPKNWDMIHNDLGPVLGRRQAGRPESVWAGQLREYDGLVVNVLETLYSSLEPGRRDLFTAGLPALQRAVDTLRPTREGEPSTVLRDALGFDEQASIDALRQGRVAMLRGWPVAYKTVTAPSGEGPAPQNTVEVCGLPGDAAVLGGQNLAVSSRSAHPDQATDLVQYLTTCDSQLLLFDQGGLAPTRACAYDRSTRAGEPFPTTLRKAVLDATPRPRGPCYGQFSALFSRTVHASLESGEPLPDGFLDDLSRKLNCKPLR